MIIISMSILPQTNWDSASVRETIDYYILLYFIIYNISNQFLIFPQTNWDSSSVNEPRSKVDFSLEPITISLQVIIIIIKHTHNQYQKSFRPITMPDIFQFWYATALFKAVKSATKQPILAKTCQNRPKLRVLYPKKDTSLKKNNAASGGGDD